MSQLVRKKEYKGHEETFEGEEYIYYNYTSLYIFVGCDMSKFLKLYILNTYSLLYVTYTSVKLLKKQQWYITP